MTSSLSVPMGFVRALKSLRRRFEANVAILAAIVVAISGCGGGASADSAPPSSPVGQPELALLAGSFGGFGNVDGVGTAARFGVVGGIAADSSGSLYVTDSGTVRKIDASATVTTLAGSHLQQGNVDGTGGAARFGGLSGIAVDGSGNIYVADSGNNSIRKVTSSGVVTTVAGDGTRGYADGPARAARFNLPGGIAVDSDGTVYVADSNNYVIRKITRDGVVTTIAGTNVPLSPGVDGVGTSARFNYPLGIALDSARNLYVADYYTLRRITPDGAVSTLAGTPGKQGHIDGPGYQALFGAVAGVTLDTAGNIYVNDSQTYIRRIDAAGNVSTFSMVSTPSSGITALASRAGALVVGTYENVIAELDSAGTMKILAGAAPDSRVLDGVGATARFGRLASIAVGPDGNVFVPDTTISGTIRRITPGGLVSTIFTDESIYNGLLSSLDEMTSISAGADGSLYIGSTYCNRSGICTGAIRRVTRSGAVSILVAPTISNTPLIPVALASDIAGNLFVADEFNNVVHKVTAAGQMTVFAGQASFEGSEVDGVGSSARFNKPRGIAVDLAGNLFVADQSTIRRIAPDGAVTTLAGSANAQGDLDGIGAAARFARPCGIAVDDTGNVYVADFGNSLVRKITPAGVVTTVAGTRGQVGFVPGSLPGVLNAPQGVAIGGSDLYVTMNFGVAVIRNRP